MEITKPNDIFIATITNPNASLLDLHQMGANSANTGFLSMDDYKKSKFVQETFTNKDTGKFDDTTFKAVYTKAAQSYDDMTSANAVSNMKKEIEYDPGSLYAPLNSKKRDVSITLEKIKNPFQEQIGWEGINKKSENSLSNRELAQKSQIFDTETGKFRNESADNLGLFKSLFSEPLVYAKYEEDGTHLDPDSGRMVKHKKGENKLNADGDLYTETLGKREIYGKEIVVSSDTLTKEGTWLNKIDFFDSDDREKSITGSVFKLAATIAPYLILGGKGKVLWGGVNAAIGLASALPTFYKMAESILTGEDDLNKTSSLFKGATSIESAFARYAGSKSDYASESMFNIEQAGQLVGDVFTQIYEQRAMASLSTLFKSKNLSKLESDEVNRFTQKYAQEFMEASEKGLIKDPKAFYKQMIEMNPVMKKIGEKQSKLARDLSLGYMTLSTTSDIYGAAIEGGYDRRTAGVAGLLAAAGQQAIMTNNVMSKWFLDETVGFNENANRSLLKNALKPEMERLDKAIKLMDINKVAGKEALKGSIKSIKNSITSTFENALDGSEAYWKAALVEGAEEVTEQMVMDATKGIIDTASWLGITKKKNETDVGFGGLNNVFSKQGFETYVMSLVGGALGGPMFKFNENVIEKSAKPKEHKDLTYLVANGHLDDLIKMTERTRKAGNSNLSPTITTIDGKELFLAAEKGQSQADIVADATIHYLKYLDGILNQEDLKQDDDSLFKKAMLNNVTVPLLQESGIHKLVIDDFANLSADVVTLRGELDKLDPKDENRKKLEGQLKEKRDEVQGFLNGDNYEQYLKESLFYLKKSVHESFSNLDIDSYSIHTYGKSFNDLETEGEGLTKAKVEKTYKEFVDKTDLRPYLKTLVSAYTDLQEKFSTAGKDYVENNYSEARKQVYEKVLNLVGQAGLPTAIKNEDFKTFIEDVTSTAFKGGLDNINLNGLLNIELSDYLEKEGLLNFSEFTFDEETNNSEKEHAKKLIDEYASKIPLQELNIPTIQKIIDEVNFSRNAAVDKEKNVEGEEVKYKAANVKLNKSSKDAKIDEIELNRQTEKLSHSISSTVQDDGTVLSDNDAKINAYDKNLLDISSAHKEIDAAISEHQKLVQEVTEEAEKEKSKLSEDLEPEEQDLMIRAINEDLGKKVKVLDKDLDSVKAKYKEHLDLEKTYSKIDSKYNEELKNVDSREDVIDLNMRLLFNFLEGEKVLDNEMLLNLRESLMPQFSKELDYIDTLFKYRGESKDYLFAGKEKGYDLIDIDEYLREFPDIYNQVNFKALKERILSNVNDGMHFQESLDEAKSFVKELIKDRGDIVGEDVINFINKTLDKIFTVSNEGLLKFEGLLKKERKTNPLYDWIRKFEITINGSTPKSIFTILQESSNLLRRSSSINNYIVDGFKFDDIVNGINILKMLQGVVNGMTESPIDLANPTGFNQSIANYLKKHQGGKNVEKYATIDGINSLHLLSDLELLIQKLEFIKSLSESNSISKSQEHKKTRETFVTTMLSKLKEATLDFNNKSILEGASNIHTLDIEDEDKLQELEMLMYNNFKKLNLNPDQYEDFISKIFTKLNFNSISEKESYGLDHNTNKISDYDYSIYILTNLGFPSNVFNLKLKNAISNENFKFAPFFGQEYAAKVGYSLHSNKALFKAFKNVVFSKSTHENLEYYNDGSNIFFLNGISGSGKTSASGQYILRMLLEKDLSASILITAPAKRQIDTIDKSLKSTLTNKELESTNIESLEKESIFDKFLKKGTYLQIMQESNGGKVTNPIIFTKPKTSILTLNEDLIEYNNLEKTDIPKAIFIDEVTHFNKIELSLLNMIANKFDITIFTFGDEYQLGASMKRGEFMIPTNIDQMFTINPMRLKVSIRPSNIHKKDNASLFETVIEKLTEESKKSYINERIKSEAEYLKNNAPIFTYYQNASEIHGDKVVDSITKEDLQILKTALENARKDPNNSTKNLKIGIVSEDSELDEDFKKLLSDSGITEDMFNVYTYKHFAENTVQGVEETYFIVRDIPYDNRVPPLNYIKALYTYAGRSLVGSLIEDRANNIKNLGFVNKRENTTNDYPLKDIDIVKEDRKKVLERLTEGVKMPDNELPDNKKTGKSKKTEEETKETKEATFEDPAEKFTEKVINTFNSLEAEITKSTNNQKGGVESIPDNKKTEFTYITHLFYNRFGVAKDDSGNLRALSGTEDLQILDIEEDDIISERLEKAFINLKNILSLYLDDESKFKESIKNNPEVIYFLQNSKIKFSARNLKNSQYADELWGFTRNNQNENNLVLLGSKYNSDIDMAQRKLNDNENNHLKEGDAFLRLAIKINSKGGAFYITLGAMPKYSTLIDPYKGGFDSSSNTAKKYSELEKIIESSDTIKEIEINKDEKKLFFYTGLRVDPLIEGNLTLNDLSKYGLNHGEVKIFNSNLEEIVKTIYSYGLNRVLPDMSEADKINNEPEAGDSDNLKLLRKLSNFKGHPYTIVNFSNIDDTTNQKVIVLTPNQRNFTTVLEEFNKIDSKKTDSKVYRKSLISKFDGIKMLFTLHRDWEKSGTSGKFSFDEFLKDLIIDRKAAAEMKGKSSATYYLFDKGEFFEQFQDFIKKHGKDSWEVFLTDKNNSLKDNKFFNLGLILLGHLKSNDYKINNIKYTKDEKEVFFNERITTILNDENNLFRGKFYYSPEPIGAEGENVKNFTLNSLLFNQYGVKAAIEMPRALITLEKTIGSQINTEEAEVIEEIPIENIKEDLKQDRISEIVDSLEDISDENKEELKSLLTSALENFEVSKESENASVIFESYDSQGEYTLEETIDALFDPIDGSHVHLLGDNSTNFDIIDTIKKCN